MLFFLMLEPFLCSMLGSTLGNFSLESDGYPAIEGTLFHQTTRFSEESFVLRREEGMGLSPSQPWSARMGPRKFRVSRSEFKYLKRLWER